MTGIKETQDGAAFFGALFSGVVKVAKDGKFQFWEAIEFRDAAALLPAAVNGYKEIDNELVDLDSEEGKALAATFAQHLELDIENQEDEALVERGVELSLEILSYINQIRQRKAQQEQA